MSGRRDAYRRSSGDSRVRRPRLRRSVRRRALARDPRSLPVGPLPPAPKRRWHRGNGGLAPLRPVPLPHVVGVGNDPGPAGAGNPLSARAGYHDRDGRGLAAGGTAGRGGRDGRARVGGPAWPLLGPLAARLVIGPVFIHGIASRTLAGLKRVLEGA